MDSPQPFIPRDKPKFWVIGVLAGLCGLGTGLVAFLSAWYRRPFVPYVFVAAFLLCWASFVVSWFGFVFGLLTGRYRNLVEKPWREQVW